MSHFWGIRRTGVGCSCYSKAVAGRTPTCVFFCYSNGANFGTTGGGVVATGGGVVATGGVSGGSCWEASQGSLWEVSEGSRLRCPKNGRPRGPPRRALGDLQREPSATSQRDPSKAPQKPSLQRPGPNDSGFEMHQPRRSLRHAKRQGALTPLLLATPNDPVRATEMLSAESHRPRLRHAEISV